MLEETRQQVYQAAQEHAKDSSYLDLGKLFDLTAAEIRRICFVLHAERVEEQERLTRAWEARIPEQRHEYEQSLLPKAPDSAWAAIKRVEDADDKFKRWAFVQGRYPGEFSQGELTLAKRSSAFRWINDVCKDVPEQILAEPWARDLRRFMEMADRTLSRRKSRRLSAIEKPGSSRSVPAEK